MIDKFKSKTLRIMTESFSEDIIQIILENSPPEVWAKLSIVNMSIFYWSTQPDVNTQFRTKYRTAVSKHGHNYFELPNKLMDGPYFFERPNGQKTVEGNYIKGNKCGRWTVRWYGTGEKYREYNFVDGKEEGLCTYWHQNGQKYEEGLYTNGNRTGLWTTWYDNGNISAQGYYINDRRDGLWTHWLTNGQCARVGCLVNGKRNGIWIDWLDNHQYVQEDWWMGKLIQSQLSDKVTQKWIFILLIKDKHGRLSTED